VFTNTVYDDLTHAATLKLITDYFCTNVASLVAPIQGVVVAEDLEADKVLVTNGQVTYTGYDPILLSLVTNDTYTASLAAIAIEVKTTITMT
jgi:hypothetical protein